MRKKKEYKKPLLAGGEDDDDEYDTDEGDITEALTAATSMYSLDAALEEEDEGSLIGGGDGDHFDEEDIGESFRSTSSAQEGGNANNKRVSRTRHSQRRSMGRLSQSPGSLNNRTRRTRSDRKLVASPGAISRKSATDRTRSPGALTRKSAAAAAAAAAGSNTTSPGALSSHRSSRVSSSSPHHLRRGPRARRRSVEGSPKDLGHDRSGHGDNSNHERGGGSARSSRRKTLTKSMSPQQSIRDLFAGHAQADELNAPDLDALDDVPDAPAEENEDSEPFDDAEVVRDELADLEGLIQAAKIKS